MHKILKDGKIIKEYKGANFLVELEDAAEGHIVDCTLGGKLRTRQIKVCLGDRVSIEISPYDLEKGRIVWRYNT